MTGVQLPFPNSMPMYMMSTVGIAHDLADRATPVTRCGLDAAAAVKVTFAQVHIFLNHAICAICFPTEGGRWAS